MISYRFAVIMVPSQDLKNPHRVSGSWQTNPLSLPLLPRSAHILHASYVLRKTQNGLSEPVKASFGVDKNPPLYIFQTLHIATRSGWK